MKEMKEYSDLSYLSLDYLNSFSGRLPGWVLFCTICKSVTSSFWFLHLTHAFILNFFAFKIIRESTNYIFSSVLLYFVLIYFELNFQIIRESLAIGFFLGALYYYSKCKWLKYYLILVIAAFIHETAIFLAILPLIRYIRINLITITLVFFGTIFLITFSDEVAEKIVTFYVSDEFTERVNYYAVRIEIGSTFTKFSNYIINVALPLIGLALVKHQNKFLWYEHLVVIYVIIYSMGLSIPIMYRFNQYFLLHFSIFFLEIFYMLSSFIGKKVGRKYIPAIYFLITILFVSYRSRIYFVPKVTGHPTYVQFYPYASIFFEEKDEEREAFVKASGI